MAQPCQPDSPRPEDCHFEGDPASGASGEAGPGCRTFQTQHLPRASRNWASKQGVLQKTLEYNLKDQK